MGSMMKTDGSGLSTQYQNLFDKQLLSINEPLIVVSQFAKRSSFPKDRGATVITFFRPPDPDRTRVTALAEGVPPSNAQAISYTTVSATMSQIGEYFRYSDILAETALFQIADQVSKTAGQDAAVYTDFACLTELIGGVDSGNKRYAGGATSFSTLEALSQANGKLTIADLNGSYTKLTDQKARKINGGYPFIVSPAVAFDIKSDSKFVDAGTHGADKGLFNGKEGMWYGNEIYVTTEGWIEDGNGAEGTYSTSSAAADKIYASVSLGREAFGAPIMAGQSPFDPTMIVVNKPDSQNPLNQYATVGWKGYWAVKTLQPKWLTVVRSKSTFA